VGSALNFLVAKLLVAVRVPSVDGWARGADFHGAHLSGDEALLDSEDGKDWPALGTPRHD